MQAAIAIVSLVILCTLAVISALIRKHSITPDTYIIAVRSTSRRWTPFTGCLRDARLEGWIWAATEAREIVRVDTGERTGRRLVSLPQPLGNSE